MNVGTFPSHVGDDGGGCFQQLGRCGIFHFADGRDDKRYDEIVFGKVVGEIFSEDGCSFFGESVVKTLKVVFQPAVRSSFTEPNIYFSRFHLPLLVPLSVSGMFPPLIIGVVEVVVNKGGSFPFGVIGV